MPRSVKIKKGSSAKFGNPIFQAVPKARTVEKKTIDPRVLSSALQGITQGIQTGDINKVFQEFLPKEEVIEFNPPNNVPKQTDKQKEKKYQESTSQSVPGAQPPPELFKPPVDILNDVTSVSTTYQSRFRPEIIALTQFNPLYDNDGNLTEQGELFEALIETFRKADVDARTFLNLSPEQQAIVVEQDKKLQEELALMDSKISELFDFIKKFSFFQGGFEVYKEFSPQEFLSFRFANNQTFTNNESLNFYVSQLQKNLTLNKSLNFGLSYPNKPADQKEDFFGSPPTRSWIVALMEMKYMLFSHSRRNMKEKMDPQSGTALSNIIFPDIKSQGRITPKKLLDAGDPTLTESNISEKFYIRFSNLQKFIDLFNDNVNGSSTLLYVALKEIRQRACLRSINEDADISIDPRNSQITSLLISSNLTNAVVYNGTRPGGQPFSGQNFFSPKSLFDIAYFGDFKARDKVVWMLEKNLIPNGHDAKISSEYLFSGFGSEDFFSKIIQQREFDNSKLSDYVLFANGADGLFFNFLSNSGVLPVQDSKLNKLLTFSTDPVKFIENACSKFIDSKGTFSLVENKKGNRSASGYTEDDDLRLLTFFVLASGNDTSKSRMASIDLNLKQMSANNSTYDLDLGFRSDVENISILKDALYSYVKRRASTGNVEVQDTVAYAIYRVLTNVSDVVGLGLRTNDDYAFSSAADYYHFEYKKGGGEFQSVIKAKQISGDISGETNGQTTSGNPVPIHDAASDEFINWTLLSIQTKPAHEDPKLGQPIECIQYIKRFLKDSPLMETIIEIMKPIVSSDLSEDFSLIFFNFLCTLLGHISPIKDIRLYIDDYEHEENNYDANNAFSPDNEIRSAIIIFTKFYLNGRKEDNLINKQKFINSVMQETNSLVSIALSMLNILSRSVQFYGQAQKDFSSFSKDTIDFFLSYLNNDPKRFELMFNEQQLSLIFNSFRDFHDSYKSFRAQEEDKSRTDQIFEKYLNGLSYSPKMVPVLREFFKDEDYRLRKGHNKKIMTVGIPQGLLKDLSKQLIKESSNQNAAKSNDLFKILLYKINLLHDDIVYLPQEFLFETSRFTVQDYSKISDLNLLTNNINDFENYLFKVFATRNYNIFNAKDINSNLFLEVKPQLSSQESFPLTEYSSILPAGLASIGEHIRLSNSILKNHITSFILENYLNVMSGLKMDENSFVFIDQDKELEALYKDLIGSEPKDKTSNPATNSNLLLPKSATLKKIISPKVFDRVFNIIFDPDSFKVDTNKTSYSVIQSKINKNIITQVGDSYYDVESYDENKDVSFNSFFVNIQTYPII